jgi:hypothetical protein
MQMHGGSGPPPRGFLKTDRGVSSGHTDAEFSAIGVPEHPGLFKVTLRFREADWSKVPANQRAWIDQQATKSGTDRLLTIFVPAIHRPMPSEPGAWSEMPWEIRWEW